MNTKQNILSILRTIKPDLEKKYGVSRLALFGSYSNQTYTDASDVDVLVEFSKPIGIEFIDLADELEDLLHIKVDLVSRNGIKAKYYVAIENELIDV